MRYSANVENGGMICPERPQQQWREVCTYHPQEMFRAIYMAHLLLLTYLYRRPRHVSSSDFGVLCAFKAIEKVGTDGTVEVNLKACENSGEDDFWVTKTARR